jgi:hypothetical protein
MFRRVVVLLDSLAPSQGSFAHGLLWAQRSRAPLFGISGIDGHVSQPVDAGMVREQNCAMVCKSYGLRWESTSTEGKGARALPITMDAGDLLVFGRPLAGAAMDMLSREPEVKSAVLVCPNEATFVNRVLVVDGLGDSDAHGLRIAADMCRAIRAGMVVLSLGASERQARRASERVHADLLPTDISIDFDVAVGPNAHGALASIARWRHCQMIITRRGRTSFWRRWLGRSRSWDWITPEESLLHLILPADQAQAAPSGEETRQEVASPCG